MSSTKAKRTSSSASVDAAAGGEGEEPQESTKSDKSKKKSKRQKKSKKKKSGDDESCSLGSGSSFYHYDSDSSSNSGSDISLPEDVKNKKFRKVMAKEASKSSLLDSASFRNGSFRRRSILSDEDDTDSREEDNLSEFQMDLTFLKSSFHHTTMNPAMSVSSSPGVPETSTPNVNPAISNNNLHNSVPNLNEHIITKKTNLGRVKSGGCEGRERSNSLRDSGRMTSSRESKEKREKQKKEDLGSVNNAEISREEIFNWASVAQDSGDKKRGSRKSTGNRKDKSLDPASAADYGYTKPGLRRSKSSGDSSTDWSMFRSFAKGPKQLASNKKGAPENDEITTNAIPKRKSKKGKDTVAEEAEEEGMFKKKGKKPTKEEAQSNDSAADGRESKKKKGKKDKVAGPDSDETLVEERRISGDSFDFAEKHDWQALAQQPDEGRSKHNWQALAQTEEQKKKGRDKKDKKKPTDKEGVKGRRNLFECEDESNTRNASGDIAESDYVYNWSPKKVPTKSPKKSKLKKTRSSEGSVFPSLPLTNQDSLRFGEAKIEKTTKLKLKKSISVGGTSSTSSSRPLMFSPSYEKMTNTSYEANESSGSSNVQHQKSKAALQSEEGVNCGDDAGASKDPRSSNNNIAPAAEEPFERALQRGDSTTSEDENKLSLSGEEDLPSLLPLKGELPFVGEVESGLPGNDDTLREGIKGQDAETRHATKATGGTLPEEDVFIEASSHSTIRPQTTRSHNIMTDQALISRTTTDSSTDSQPSTYLTLEYSSHSMEESMGGSNRTEQSSKAKTAMSNSTSSSPPKEAPLTLDSSNQNEDSQEASTRMTGEVPKPGAPTGSSTNSLPNYTFSTVETPSRNDDLSGGSNQHADETLDSRKATGSSTSSTHGETSSTAETSSWSDGSKSKMETPDQFKGSSAVVKVNGPSKAPKKKKKRSTLKLGLQMDQNTTLNKGEEEHQEALITYANSIMKIFTDDPKQYSDEAAMALLQEFPRAAKMKYALESSPFERGQGKTRHYLLSLLCALGANKQCVSMCFNLHPDAIHKFDEHVGTPLHYAISFGITASFSREMWTDSIFETVEFLLAQEPLLLSSQHNDLSQSALHQAILSLCPSPDSMSAGQKHDMNDYEQLTEIADVVVSMLLENHSSIATLPDSKNLLPLHLAALRVVPVEILERILNEHTPACLVKCFAKGFTPLHYAVQGFGLAASTIVPRANPKLEDHAANIETLLRKHPSAAQIQDNSGDLPLHILFSTFYGQYSMDVESDRICCDASGSTFENVARLLTVAHPEAANTPGSSGKTPIMIVQKLEGSAAVIDAVTNPLSQNPKYIAN